MEHVILWKLVIAMLFSQEITTCPNVKWIQSTSLHPFSAIPILVLFSHILQGIPVDLFPSGILTKILYKLVICALVLHPLSMLSHPQPNLFRLVIFGKEYILWTSHVGQYDDIDVHDLLSYHNE